MSRTRLILALLVAAVSDVISIGDEVFMPIQWGVDVLTALALFAIMGWRWPLLPALIAEAIPGVALFPAWVLVVAAMGGHEQLTARRKPLEVVDVTPSPTGGPEPAARPTPSNPTGQARPQA